VPAPERKSELPIGCMAPLNLEEAALQLERMLSSGHEDIFKPVPTGFGNYDRVLGGGLHAGDLHILSGVQNIGKTAKILQMASAIAAQGILALMVCYEHNVITLWERLLCQASYRGYENGYVTANALQSAYIEAVRKRDRMLEAEDGKKMNLLDEVIDTLPDGVKSWTRLSEYAQNLWLVRGDGLYTTLDALAQYLEIAFRYNNRVVLMVDYLQQIPVIETERRLTAEERIERALKGLKGLALRYTNDGKFLPVVAVAAVDGRGLRRGRVHVEDLWGNAIMQYEPDVVWVGNRDGKTEEGHSVIRWGIEKNRRGPSDVEFRHVYHGAAYYLDPMGEPVPEADSWQQERRRVTTMEGHRSTEIGAGFAGG
jgi:hypothetical protein